MIFTHPAELVPKASHAQEDRTAGEPTEEEAKRRSERSTGRPRTSSQDRLLREFFGATTEEDDDDGAYFSSFMNATGRPGPSSAAPRVAAPSGSGLRRATEALLHSKDDDDS
jgi:hypothetical protein